MTVLDPLTTTKTLLSTNWNSANTQSITPVISIPGDGASRDSLGINRSEIRLYTASEVGVPNDCGPSFKKKEFDRVQIDIRTKVDRTHKQALLNEVERIVGAATNAPGGGYQQIIEADLKTDRSTPGFWRHIFDISLRIWDLQKGA